jgi:tRNA (cytidine32/uridine32-2'-O)-methyltransferase
MESLMLSFRIILVEPEHPHNVGFVARAMRCNALPDLHIVYDSRTTVMDESYHTAHSSKDVLENAKVTSTLEEALSGCAFAVAFSRRRYDSVLPHVLLPALCPKLPREGKVALVFGRESKGLTIEEIEHCALICEIPVPGLMSMNLAQAVAVSSYELCRAGLLSGSGERDDRAPLVSGQVEKADLSQIESFLGFIQANLTDRYQKLPWTEASVRGLLQRFQPTRFEMDAIFGLARSLAKSSARSEKNDHI